MSLCLSVYWGVFWEWVSSGFLDFWISSEFFVHLFIYFFYWTLTLPLRIGWSGVLDFFWNCLLI